jgi:uncharacterized protein YdeI (YjbR/CyaY-like superfamily)
VRLPGSSSSSGGGGIRTQSDSRARAAFDGLSYTHRKEYVRWIKQAKRDETRRRRIAKALEMLPQGKTPG